MFEGFRRKWKEWRLSKLDEKNVKYNPVEQTITISKGAIQVKLKAVYEESETAVKISGDHIVVNNNVVKAIWKALWNQPVLPVAETEEAAAEVVTFSKCSVHSAPNFLAILKEEVISID